MTLNVSRDSSQPFCVGQSGVVGEISSGAVSGVITNERSNLPFAVVAGVGHDSVGFSVQVPLSTISGFSSFGVFFLGVVRQYSSCGQGAHVTCPFSNGKVRRQDGLKDYPSAMLSTSTLQEWNGTTVTLHMETSLPFSLW